jgi:alkanesulfonate monooxygenase SsuD/methylene tetrahydromethanopterin reductase-like flavin-dependent oxidoreductase (luciferase family)
VQKPRPPIMIAGGGEQLTLRAVARLADACNVGGSPDGEEIFGETISYRSIIETSGNND